jgi:L-lactate dehydrogenase complex protein LldG
MSEKDKEIQKIFNDYMAEIIADGAENETLRIALKRAVNSYRGNLKKALELFPDSINYKDKARKIKEYSIDHLEELVEQTKKAVERNHGVFHFAKDADEANEIIADIVGEPKKTIVKGKSLTTEETELRQYLQEKGHEVWETDLGEFLVQIRDGRPMHMLAPSVDLTREEAAELISKITGKDLPRDRIDTSVEAVREFLRDKFTKADTGISGANVLAAETGTLFIIENEGNIKVAASCPDKYVALVGVEKIVPTLEDAMHLVKTTWRFANYVVPSYVHMISGPSKTGDIEKTTTYGAHGPREFHLVLLDNGRLDVAKNDDFKELLYCMKCGACMYECPVFWVTAGHFGKKYPGGIGALWDAFIATGMEEAAPAVYSCAICGRCKTRCPLNIDTDKMIKKLRKILYKKGYTPSILKEMKDTFFKE